MGHIENFKPQPVEVAAQQGQKLVTEAYTSTEGLKATAGALPPEFGHFIVEYRTPTATDSEMRISVGVTENKPYQDAAPKPPAGVDDPARAFFAHPIPTFQKPAGMEEAEKELKEGRGSTLDQVGLGIQVGTVKGVIGLANGILEIGNLALSPGMRAADFLANTIKNPDLAYYDADRFGIEAANNIYGGMKAVLTADKYLEDVSKAELKGDFLKVPRDVSNVISKLNPGQQAELLTEQAVIWGTPAAIGVVGEGTNALAQMQAKIAEFEAKAKEVAGRFGVVSAAKKGDEVAESIAAASEPKAIMNKDGRDMPTVQELPTLSGYFPRLVTHAFDRVKERLSPAERAIADELSITGYDSLAHAPNKYGQPRGDGWQGALGAYEKGQIQIAEHGRLSEGWLKNRQVQSTVAHEVGHAVNVMLGAEKGAMPCSERVAFKEAFSTDYANLKTGEDIEKFNQLFNNTRFFEDGTKTIDMIKVRDEVFAELFCQAKGYPPCSNYAAQLRELFTDTADVVRTRHGYTKK